jgi:hypothetical protein
MKLIEMCCKNCGASLQPENLSMQLLIARCPHCDAVFAIADASRGESAAEAQARQPVAMPRQIQVLDQGYGLEIRRSWFTPMLFFLVFFCVFWNGFMVVWHVISLSTGMWLMSGFGLLHTAVGMGLVYITIAGFVNQTVIRVGQGMLSVQHGPLPWFGNKTVPSHQIKQLYCKEHVQRSENSNSLTYSVEMILDHGRETLVKGLQECEQAIFIEQALERFLKIEDKPVSGELPRGVRS